MREFSSVTVLNARWFRTKLHTQKLITSPRNSLEQWFSTWGTRTPWGYAALKNKHRNRLDVEDDLRLYLSKITAIIDEQCKGKQAQPSHWLPGKMFIIFVKLFMPFFVFIDIRNLWRQNLMCVHVLFYSHCYTITIVLSIYTRGMPVTMAAWSKAWNVFARSNTGTVSSNLARGMDVCMRLFCVCVVLCR
jgi:hypothetical protein